MRSLCKTSILGIIIIYIIIFIHHNTPMMCHCTVHGLYHMKKTPLNSSPTACISKADYNQLILHPHYHGVRVLANETSTSDDASVNLVPPTPEAFKYGIQETPPYKNGTCTPQFCNSSFFDTFFFHH